jgi:hypothetical protein
VTRSKALYLIRPYRVKLLFPSRTCDLLSGPQIIARSLPLDMKYWEIVADKLSEAGWSWGCVSAVDSQGETTWIADAHRDNGKRFVGRSDEKLTAFLELESATRVCGDFS